MAYPYQPYTPAYPSGAGYAPGYYPAQTQPVPDQLAQLRQNQMAQLPMQMPPAMPQPQNNMIWVQGEAGAKAYLVANGNTVPLWDSEQPYVYIKTVDAAGVPSMRRLRTVDETDLPPQTAAVPPPPIDLSGYVTREELDAILSERLKKPAPKTAGRQKEEADNG